MKKITIVTPCFNEEGNVYKFTETVSGVLNSLKKYDYEILLVDDGSTDSTLEKIKELAANNKRIKYVSFSRNFGHMAALRAGLDSAKGDAVISMDGDLQHPPSLLPELINKWESGYDIVYTLRKDDETDRSFFVKTASRWFYRMLNWLSGIDIKEGAADFRLLDKRVVKEVQNLHEPQLFIRGFIPWCGYKQYAINYTPAKRFSGKSKYNFKRLTQLATQGITSFSIKPLQLSLILGFISAILGGIYGIFVLIDYFVRHNSVAGWTSVVIIILIMGGVQLSVLGIIGEYLGRLFIQNKQRPDYLIREENINE